ncbi:MAG TPA: thioredoxin domain-containing protein [Pyrinomonadaceae bacterium]|nr:thioredoxin domain-containing protein [Pyrinomonadaceae bacterium]
MKKAILFLVVLAVAGILAYKFIGSGNQTNDTKPSVANTAEAAVASSPVTKAQTTEAQKIFYLFHNPKDQDEECRKIYAYADRAERELAGRVIVKRPDVKTESALVEKYKVKVLPTILIASPDGTEQERFEGEGEKVSTGVENAIARLKETK